MMIRVTVLIKNHEAARLLQQRATESVELSWGADTGVTSSNPKYLAPANDDTAPMWEVELHGEALQVGELLEAWGWEEMPKNPRQRQSNGFEERYMLKLDVERLLDQARRGLDHYELHGEVKHPGLVKAHRRIDQALERVTARLKAEMKGGPAL